MTDVSITFSPRDVRRFLKTAFGPLQKNHKRALDAAAGKALEIIETRTRDGYSINGARFKRYTKSYADYRVANNLNPYPVDLSFSGAMLRSMHSTRTGKNERILRFRGGDNNKKAAMNNKTRPFFGLNARDRKRVSDTYLTYLTRRP